MRFLRILLWLIAIVAGLIFAIRNWDDVSLALWGDVVMDIRLPLLLILTWLGGMVPTWLILSGRLAKARRQLALAEHARLAPAAGQDQAGQEQDGAR